MADTTTQGTSARKSLPELSKPRFQRPKNRTTNKVPALIKKSDPLWKDSFILDGETGFGVEESAKEFEADAAGYVQLVESEYKAIADVDKHYVGVRIWSHLYVVHPGQWPAVFLFQ